MCTEFVLAFIYFNIILLINFLLGKLLVSYNKSLTSLLKVKTIFNIFEKKQLNLVLFLNNKKKKELKFLLSINQLKNFSDNEDILIIGNIYKSFVNDQNNSFLNFYFPLLEQQYLFSDKNK